MQEVIGSTPIFSTAPSPEISGLGFFMALPTSLVHRLEQDLGRYAGRTVHIGGEQAVGGGSINDAYRLSTSAGTFFVKVNDADRHPSMFDAEADGLERLRATTEIR